MTISAVLVTESITEVEQLLDRAVAVANTGYRTRLATHPDLSRTVAPEGAVQTDGGGVANSYGYAATTSVVGLAWVTIRGRRHWRVVGRRTKPSGRNAPVLFRGSESSIVHVYPELSLGLTRAEQRKLPRLAREMVKAVEADRLDVASWSALADLLEEQGHFAAPHVRLAARRAAQLAG